MIDCAVSGYHLPPSNVSWEPLACLSQTAAPSACMKLTLQAAPLRSDSIASTGIRRRPRNLDRLQPTGSNQLIDRRPAQAAELLGFGDRIDPPIGRTICFAGAAIGREIRLGQRQNPSHSPPCGEQMMDCCSFPRRGDHGCFYSSSAASAPGGALTRDDRKKRRSGCKRLSMPEVIPRRRSAQQ